MISDEYWKNIKTIMKEHTKLCPEFVIILTHNYFLNKNPQWSKNKNIDLNNFCKIFKIYYNVQIIKYRKVLMNKVLVVVIMFLVSSCEEEQVKDWTDDPKYDPKPNSLLRF